MTGSVSEEACIDCVVGKYSDVSARYDLAQCIDCVVGKYMHLTGSDEAADCIACPTGKYINVIGSDEAGDCIECIAGRYIDVVGSDSLEDCINCAPGKYVDVTGSDHIRDCTNCVAGKYVEATGSDEAVDCIVSSQQCLSLQSKTVPFLAVLRSPPVHCAFPLKDSAFSCSLRQCLSLRSSVSHPRPSPVVQSFVLTKLLRCRTAQLAHT